MSIVKTLRELKKTPLLKSNLWEIQILDPNKLGFNMEKDYFLATEVTIDYPSINTERDQVQDKNYITGYSKPESLAISFLETEALEVTDFLETLRRAIYKDDKTVRYNVNPQIEIVLILQRFRQGIATIEAQMIENILSFGGFGSSTFGIESEYLEPIKAYKATGAFYKERSSLSLNYENEGPTIIEATFAIEELIEVEDIITASLLTNTNVQT